MSKIKLTGSNSGYVEIDSAADAGNLTLTLPTAGTALLSNAGNVFSGITTTAELDINGRIDVSTDIVGGRNLKVTGITTLSDDLTLTGASYNVLWDKSDNQLEFGDNAKLSFGAPDIQIYHDSSDNISKIDNLTSNILQIRNLGNNKIVIKPQNSFPVELYFNNTKRFTTTSAGAAIVGVCSATSFSGDGSALTGVLSGITTEALVKTNGQTASLDLSKDDHKVTATGTVTIDVTGGSEADSHTLRIVNSGIATVGFSTYFIFPSGGTPSLPTASGSISLISFTVHRAGAVGVSTQLLSGASVNFS